MTEHAPPVAEAGTRVVFPVHREEVRALDRGVAAGHRRVRPGKHMAIVGYLKSQYGMGHGHANALVGWTLQATSPVLDAAWRPLSGYSGIVPSARRKRTKPDGARTLNIDAVIPG